jgi:hypothetical protein
VVVNCQGVGTLGPSGKACLVAWIVCYDSDPLVCVVAALLGFVEDFGADSEVLGGLSQHQRPPEACLVLLALEALLVELTPQSFSDSLHGTTVLMIRLVFAEAEKGLSLNLAPACWRCHDPRHSCSLIFCLLPFEGA